MLIIGIDDAGRGPAIGPMVLSGVLIEKETERELARLGVKDSKMILPRKREILAETIKKLAINHFTKIISAEEIDGKNNDGLNLNQREALAAAMIINKLNKNKESIKVIIDCPSVNIESWQKEVEKYLIGSGNIHLVCEHKADVNHLSVAAASIIAKTTRDAEIEKLKKKFDVNFGSGYSSDPTTRKFIYDHYEEFAGKGLFRESWATIKKHKSHKTQQKLF